MTDWRDRAACAGEPQADFFPDHLYGQRLRAHVARIKRDFCDRCATRPECGALGDREERRGGPGGIYAGRLIGRGVDQRGQRGRHPAARSRSHRPRDLAWRLPRVAHRPDQGEEVVRVLATIVVLVLVWAAVAAAGLYDRKGPPFYEFTPDKRDSTCGSVQRFRYDINWRMQETKRVLSPRIYYCRKRS